MHSTFHNWQRAYNDIDSIPSITEQHAYVTGKVANHVLLSAGEAIEAANAKYTAAQRPEETSASVLQRESLWLKREAGEWLKIHDHLASSIRIALPSDISQARDDIIGIANEVLTGWPTEGGWRASSNDKMMTRALCTAYYISGMAKAMEIIPKQSTVLHQFNVKCIRMQAELWTKIHESMGSKFGVSAPMDLLSSLASNPRDPAQ